MALTIATGFVVDDAIVMIENIARYIEEGEPPLAGRAQGRRADRLHHPVADRLAGRRAHPAAVHGRRGGPALPRVRDHPRHHHPHLGGGVADAHADDVRPLLRHTPPERQGRVYRWSERVFERIIAGYGASLRWVLAHQPATLLVAVATLVLTVVLYVVVPKGFFPVQDTGVILGISEAPQSISFAAMAERQQALARGHPARSGRREPVVLHRRRRHQHHAQQRPHPHQPQAARRARAERQRGHPAPAAGAGRRSRASRSSCSRCRT